MSNNIIMRSAFILLLTGMLLISAVSAAASVEFSSDEAAYTESITIAGNPDFYPYEYYDESSGTYKGLFPELMEIVSEKTGLYIVYVFTGDKDQQLYQSKTGNADIISAFVKDDSILESYNLSYGETVITYRQDNKEIGIAYTRFIENDAAGKINAALAEISPEQKLAILSKYMGNETEEENGLDVRLILVILAAVAAALAVTFILIFVRKKKNKKDNNKDSLTGLYNRAYFDTFFEKTVGSKASTIFSIAYIAFDIVRVNANYGEEAAEEQLRYAAGLLNEKITGVNDIVSRYSGGGFMLLHTSPSEQQTEEWIKDIIMSLNNYVKKHEMDYKPYFSAGVYRMEPGFWDRKSAVSDAQRSYQYAVDKGLPYYIADSNESARNLIKMHLKGRISKALTDDEFKQYFQPVVRADTGKIIGAETLSRWFHPEMGVLSPGRYVEMMEEEGTISELDFLIFEKVCMTLDSWKKEGCGLVLSTNFTRVSLSSHDFYQKIVDTVSKYDFDHNNCIIEITEDCLENNLDRTSQNVKKLKSLGFRIAIDDLGTGYTFFSDFINYKIDIVKIAREVLILTDSDEGRALIKGIVNLCKNLNIEVLVEGVENQRQLNLVRELNCDYIQGFYFYKAMPEPEFNNLILKDV